MRAVVQRVRESRVEVKGEVVGAIGPGFLVLLGVGREDTEEDAAYLVSKIPHLRVFPDASGAMNLSLLDRGGALLVVSQFTLFADCRKGRRPSFTQAAEPGTALTLYGRFVEGLRALGLEVETGRFQEMMDVHLVNDGPVTLLLDSRKVF